MPRIMRLKADDLQLEEMEVEHKIVSLEDIMKGLDGGYIEHVSYNLDLANNRIDMWVDEEGKLKPLKVSTLVYDFDKRKVVEVLNGNIVFTGNDGCGNSLALDDIQRCIVRNTLNQVAYVEDKQYMVLKYR